MKRSELISKMEDSSKEELQWASNTYWQLIKEPQARVQ